MADEHKNQTGYDRWSDFYDEYPNPTVAIDELCFTHYVTAVRNRRVLEIGCGTGRHTVKLAAANELVVGIDLSPGMLAQARGKLSGEHVHLYQMDFLQGDIPMGPFDYIVMSLVLEHFGDLDRFFAKAATLLLDGGKILFSEIHAVRSEQGALAHFKDQDGQDHHLASHSHTDGAIRTAAKNAGFRENMSETVVGSLELADMRAKWSKYVDQPMIKVWEFQWA